MKNGLNEPSAYNLILNFSTDNSTVLKSLVVVSDIIFFY